MIYIVRKIYKYSEEVEVIAENETEAKDKAMTVDGKRIHDDTLWDCEVVDYKQE